MPVNMSNPTGFNQWFEDTIDQFRKEAIDDHKSGGNLDPINDHVVGPADADALASQYAWPIVWSVVLNHSPAYATTATDQGTMSVRVVVFASDTDPKMAQDKARTLGGRIVDNVEGSALVDSNGDPHAAEVLLDDFQLDSRPTSAEGAQTKFCELAFDIEVERKR